jgi:hypothetical protein
MIVHIGYHKTGTTYLQKKIFPNLTGLAYYSIDREDILAGLSRSSTLDLDIESLMEKVNSIKQKRKVLYSNEGLTGPLFCTTGINKKEIADNLKIIGVDKIIITVRNQVDLIESIYKQYIQEGGVSKFENFINDSRFSFKINHLNFSTLIKYYSDLFGKENVLILTNEELRTKEQQTVRKLESFTNSKYEDNGRALNPRQSNRSISSASLKLLRMTNHFTRSPFRPSNLILPKQVTTWKLRYMLQRFLDPYIVAKLFRNHSLIKEDIRIKLEDYYREGNREVRDEFGIDLAEFNYPI